MQNIVYGEYLPTILGVDFMKSYDLIVAEETKYDPNVDSSVFNAFATAAFRYCIWIQEIYLKMARAIECLRPFCWGTTSFTSAWGGQK